MARGNSLERINELKDFGITECMLVNKFVEELGNPIIYDFVKDKEVTHICNAGVKLLRKEQYEGLNFKYFICCATESNKHNDSGYNDFIRLHLNKEIRFIPDDFTEVAYCEEIGRDAPSTGLVAIEYATETLKRKDVYIIGVDFHEAPYLTKYDAKNVRDGWWMDRRRGIYANNMNKWFNWWVRKNPNTNFHILTNAKTRCDAPNVEYING